MAVKGKTVLGLGGPVSLRYTRRGSERTNVSALRSRREDVGADLCVRPKAPNFRISGTAGFPPPDGMAAPREKSGRTRRCAPTKTLSYPGVFPLLPKAQAPTRSH